MLGSLSVFFSPPILLLRVLFQHHLIFDPDLTYFSHPILHPPLFLAPQISRLSLSLNAFPLLLLHAGLSPPEGCSVSTSLGCLPDSLSLYHFITPSGKPEPLHLSHTLFVYLSHALDGALLQNNSCIIHSCFQVSRLESIPETFVE